MKDHCYTWLMIAFAPFPGFARSKSNASWYAFYPTRELAIIAKHKLVAANIAFKCRKISTPNAALQLAQRQQARQPRIDAELGKQEISRRSTDALQRADRVGKEYRLISANSNNQKPNSE